MPSIPISPVEPFASRSGRRRLLGGLAAGALGAWIPGTAAQAGTPAPLQVIHPGPASPTDTRSAYYIELLDLALRKSGVPFERKPHPAKMVGARVLQALEAGDSLTISWRAHDPLYDERLLPIRINLDHGMLGWRLMLIRSRDREAFGAIRNIEQLRAFSAGQQRDWMDTAILRANGLPVEPALLYETLFEMLAAGRFDYCPRGVTEIWDEARLYGRLGLEIQPTLALHYPLATWFYVNRQSRALASAVEKGLLLAQADGSMERLFEQRNGEAMRRARLTERIVLELKA